jgi:hypothetical protein
MGISYEAEEMPREDASLEFLAASVCRESGNESFAPHTWVQTHQSPAEIPKQLWDVERGEVLVGLDCLLVLVAQLLLIDR